MPVNSFGLFLDANLCLTSTFIKFIRCQFRVKSSAVSIQGSLTMHYATTCQVISTKLIAGRKQHCRHISRSGNCAIRNLPVCLPHKTGAANGLSKGCAIVLCPISLKTAAFLDTLLKFLYNEHGGVVRPAL